MNQEKKDRLYKEMLACKLEDLISSRMRLDRALNNEFGQRPTTYSAEVFKTIPVLAQKYGWDITIGDLEEIWKLQHAVD